MIWVFIMSSEFWVYWQGIPNNEFGIASIALMKCKGMTNPRSLIELADDYQISRMVILTEVHKVWWLFIRLKAT